MKLIKEGRSYIDRSDQTSLGSVRILGELLVPPDWSFKVLRCKYNFKNDDAWESTKTCQSKI